VYGQGGQTRGFLNIKDTLNCIQLSVENPAAAGELRVFNQFTETFSVADLAERVARAGRQLGLSVAVKSVPNPRKEAEKHYYNPVHTGLLSLGLKPHFLTDEVLAQLMGLVIRYKNRIDPDRFLRNVRWA
jgi:UDP-sulfoquinovose synthase